jgi:hypothetical protein
MSTEESGNPEGAFIRCGLGGAVGIVLIAIVIGYSVFVLGDRIKKTQAAKHLNGGWGASDGTEYWFDFSSGYTGTVEVWSPESQYFHRARIVWRRGQELVVAIGYSKARENLYMIRMTGHPDRVTMREEGTGTATMDLRRKGRGRPPSD